jgi:hypothetical protein
LKQTIRIPVQFFVRMTEPNAGVGGSSLEGPIWASQATDYSLVGYENPLGDIYTDWTMIPLYVPKGATRVDFTAYDVAGKDDMDVFVFDSAGNEIDSTVRYDPFNIVPGAQLYPSSSKSLPETVSILDNSTERKNLTLPQTVWIAVSDTGPIKAPTMSRYHLDVDMIGAASPGIAGVKAPGPAPKPEPQPRSLGEHMPATGVGVPTGIALGLLGLAGATGTWLRARRFPK